MPGLRSLFSGLLRRQPRHEEPASPVSPAPNTAPEPSSGAGLGATMRTVVEQQQVVEGQVNATVLHDVLVSAGVNLESNQMAVVVGTPRLVSSSLSTSADGKFLDREEEIEVKVVIKTKQRLALFVDALAGATVEGATLTLTPRPAEPATVSTVVEPSPNAPAVAGSSSGSAP